MRKLILAVLFLASFSAMATETSSFRIHNDIISVGDSFGALYSRAGKPKSQYSYPVDTGRNTSITVTDFIYEVGNEIYTVTVREGKVVKIDWVRR